MVLAQHAPPGTAIISRGDCDGVQPPLAGAKIRQRNGGHRDGRRLRPEKLGGHDPGRKRALRAGSEEGRESQDRGKGARNRKAAGTWNSGTAHRGESAGPLSYRRSEAGADGEHGHDLAALVAAG